MYHKTEELKGPECALQIPSSSNYLHIHLPNCMELPSGNVRNLFRRDSTCGASTNSSAVPLSLAMLPEAVPIETIVNNTKDFVVNIAEN